MKRLCLLLMVMACFLGGTLSAHAQCAFNNRSSCYTQSSYHAPSYTYYTPYYYPTYYTYVPYYNPYSPSYYGSNSSAEQTTQIATQTAAQVVQATKQERILELLLEIKAKGGNVPPDLLSPAKPKVEPTVPPPEPTALKPRSERSTKTEVDPKWQAAVTESCISCHGGAIAKAKGGGFDMSDLSTVSYPLRLACVNKMARHEMPKGKALPEEKNGYIGLASDWAAAAEQQVARKE